MKRPMTNNILFQLNQANLLPHISDLLLEETPPALSELVFHLLISLMDAHALTTGDPKSTWTEIRLSHQNVANGFMLALLIDRSDQTNNSDGSVPDLVVVDDGSPPRPSH
jgi:hypothetical protein